jgi:hypothetical protein
VAALLILPERNRNWQAWLILVPAAVVAAPWQALSGLLPVASSEIDAIAFFFTSLATTWAILWLMADWFQKLHGATALGLAAIVLLATGVLGSLSFFGDVEAEAWVPMIGLHAGSAMALLAAMALSGRSCGGEYQAGPFLLWTMVWIVPSVGLGLCVFACVMVAVLGMGGAEMLLFAVPMVIGGSIFGSVVLYLMNLPFLLLAFLCPLYRGRLQGAFRVREPGNSPLVPVAQP